MFLNYIRDTISFGVEEMTTSANMDEFSDDDIPLAQVSLIHTDLETEGILSEQFDSVS